MKAILGLPLLLGALVGAALPAIAAGTVYVPLGSADEVLVIDTAGDLVVDQVSGLEASHGLASTPSGDFLVVGSYAETAPDETGLPTKPKGMSAAEHQAHHSAPAAPAPAEAVSFVSIIRTADNAVVRRIEVPGAVHHTAVTRDGRFALATHPNSGSISVIDLAAYKVVTTVRTGPLPNYVVTSRDGMRVYVSNAGNDTISEVDTRDWAVRRDLPAGESPEHIALSTDDRTLYVNNVGAGTVSAISLLSGKVVETFAIGGVLHGIDLSDDGKVLFVSARERDELVAIDLESKRMRRVRLGPSPYHLATIGGTGKLYVSSADEPKIWVVDQKSLRTLGEIPIRGQGHQMAIVQR